MVPAILLAPQPALATVFKLVQAYLVEGSAKRTMPRAVTIAEEGAGAPLEPATTRRGAGEDEDVDDYSVYRISVTLPGHAPFVVP